MSNAPVRTVLLSGLIAGSLATAHDGDPKALVERTPYQGPSWRSAVDDGSLAGGFDFDGVQLAANITMPDLGGGEGADCWSYTSPSGREYALMTTTLGTNFVEITNPRNPQIIAYLDGPNCLWRDVKVYEDHCYIVSDCGGGMQVVSLAGIDAGVVSLVNTVNTGPSSSSHNIAIDTDTGLIARCGGGNNLGLVLYDATVSKTNPPLVGEWTPIYVHDLQLRTFSSGPYAGRTLAYCCGGLGNGSGNTRLAIVDVTNPASPQLLAETGYPGAAFCHQGWLTEDSQIFYINDELYNGSSSTFIFDVSDPTDPTFVSRWTNGLGSAAHNCYVKGDRLYAANYRSGLRVLDISDPLAPQEIAYFDTYPGSNSISQNGAWTACPYFDSGTVIVSDIERGLFVFAPEGASVGFNPVGGVPAQFPSSGGDLEVAITISGGQLDPGSGLVVFNDGTGNRQVDLLPLGFGTFRATLPELACPGQLSLSFLIRDVEGELFESGVYTSTIADFTDLLVDVDFNDFAGWTATSNAATGGWERGIPSGDSISVDDCSAPATDADGSGGCWLTGNGVSATACANDIDDGTTVLLSAVYQTDATDPEVVFSWWYDNSSSDNDQNDDPFVVELSGDSWASWTTILTVPLGTSAQTGWTESSFRVNDFVALTSGLRLRVTASDLAPASVVEAGLDAFRIRNPGCNEPFNPADINVDGFIDGQDLALVLGNWNCTGTCVGDITQDALVNGQDLALVLANWNPR
ncbi:MAG: choice-of-anchor B family protein [Planctomycetota bacterium]|nr:choice-of-anchor B family protein [Planctomycetota bacterium]